MKIVHWQIVLVILVISACFVNCAKDHKKDKKDKKSHKKKNYNQRHSNKRGKDQGSSEYEYDDDLSINTTEANKIQAISNLEAHLTALKPSEPFESVTDQNNNVDPVTEETSNQPTTTENNDNNNADKIGGDSDSTTYKIYTMVPSSLVTATPNKSTNTFYPVYKLPLPTAIQTPITVYNKLPTNITPQPQGTATSGRPTRPADCITCRHPPTTTQNSNRGTKIKPTQHSDKKVIVGKPHTISTNQNNKKSQSLNTSNPMKTTNGMRNQRFFANEPNYWFGIYLPNRLNTFYYNRPVPNYFRSDRNYWYGLYLPNKQTYFQKHPGQRHSSNFNGRNK